jgi:hypothetical protein
VKQFILQPRRHSRHFALSDVIDYYLDYCLAQANASGKPYRVLHITRKHRITITAIPKE